MVEVRPRVAAYGSWASPITADAIVAGSVRLGLAALDGQDAYWLEGRASEGGRNALVRAGADGMVGEVTPSIFNVRTRVHEYGGGAFAVRNGLVVFVHDGDQRLYRLDATGGDPQPLTPESDGALRYADIVFDAGRDRVICVREDHRGGGEAVNSIVAVSLAGEAGGDEGAILVEGTDFVAAPRLSPDGSRLVWLAWNHPSMPWDGTDLKEAEFTESGKLGAESQVAGGVAESIFQPEWSPNGDLIFVSDRSGWWNLYRQASGTTEIQALYPMAAEFGLPLWVFGMRTYDVLDDGRIVCAYCESGTWSLAILDPERRHLDRIDLPYHEIDNVSASGSTVLFHGGSPSTPKAIVRLDLATGERIELRRATEKVPDAGYLSMPRTVEFPTEGGLTAFGFFYPPSNRDFVGPEGERPPLLVLSHGGPTGATEPSFELPIQYWTSRGIAVLDVNYGGSTGYGRAYRERLNGAWGIVDVDDCCNGARWLADQGEVDGARLMIRGGSAGGYTTLAALTFRDVFAVGASHYGISDLETMATDTHKFESRYLDNLIGPYPERKDLYEERSPIHFTELLSCPLILFQGLEDKVVPPSQAETMYAAVKAKGLPVAYIPFAGEQHGFRRAENVKRALEAELYFYGKVLGFEPADAIEPVPIENL